MTRDIVNGSEVWLTCNSCGRREANLKLFRGPAARTPALLCHDCLRQAWTQRVRWRRAAEEREALFRAHYQKWRDNLAAAARRADIAPAGDWGHLHTCQRCKAFCSAILRAWRRQGPADTGPPPLPAVLRELGWHSRKRELWRIQHEAYTGHPLRIEPLLRVLEGWGARQDNSFELE